MKYLPLTLVFLSLSACVYANNKTKEIDTLQIHQLYKTMSDEFYTVPLDTSSRRAHYILYKIGDVKKEEKTSLEKTQGKVWAFLMNLHSLKEDRDSINFYFDRIQDGINDDDILGISLIYKARININEDNHLDCLENLEKALLHFKRSKNHRLYTTTLVALSKLYRKTNSVYYLKDIQQQLNRRLDSVDPITKVQIQFSQAFIFKEENRLEDAVDVLEKIDTTDMGHNTILKRMYFGNLSFMYLHNDQLDLALKSVHKAHSYENVLKEEMPKNILLATIYYEMNDLEKASFYFNKIESKVNNDNISVLQIEEKEYYQMKYKLSEKMGQPEKALKYFKKYSEIKDSIHLFYEKENMLILNYKLKKEDEIVRLVTESKNKELQAEKARSNLVLTIVIGSLIMFFVLIFIFHYKKKKHLKNSLELKHEREISKLKNHFIENLSHEFITPISVIKGYLDLIRMNVFNHKKVTQYLDYSNKSTEDFIETLNDFLRLLKIEKKGLSLSKKIEYKNLDKFIKETVASFIGVAHSQYISLYYATNIDENKMDLEFDYQNLKKVLNNLISNAIKFSSPKSKVEVTATLHENYLQIKVKDEGIGISKEEQSKIFDHFYQSSKQAMYGGFGIGLSLVKSIITMWNGEIILESDELKGTSFEVLIPIGIKKEKHHILFEHITHNYVYTENEEIIESINVNNLPKALIIEDSEEMSTYLEEILSPIVYCTIAYNGHEGLEKVKNDTFDIIISDLRMPIMNGFEFRKQLNTLDNYKNIPFLMISASLSDFKLEERISLNISEFIVKPFSSIEIYSRVKHLLKENVFKDNLFKLSGEFKIIDTDFSVLINKINDIVLQHIKDADFNVTKLSEEIGYSKRHLTKLLQSKMGLTTLKIINEIRMIKAYELIKDQKKSTLNEVMYEVGINSRSHFNKLYENRFGIMPGKMFKEYKR